MKEKTICKSLLQARKIAKLTQGQLAELVGVSRAAISFWENGVNVPNVLDLWKMADALDMSIDELIGRDF